MFDEELKNVIELNKDIIKEPFDKLYELMGVEKFVCFIDMFSGTTLYIPNKRYILKDIFKQSIKNEYYTSSPRELAKKYNFTERSIIKFATEDNGMRKKDYINNLARTNFKNDIKLDLKNNTPLDVIKNGKFDNELNTKKEDLEI